jgi:hypothetical protein
MDSQIEGKPGLHIESEINSLLSYPSYGLTKEHNEPVRVLFMLLTAGAGKWKVREFHLPCTSATESLSSKRYTYVWVIRLGGPSVRRSVLLLCITGLMAEGGLV